MEANRAPDTRPEEVIFSVREASEGGFEAEALGHAIFTEADTLEELRKNIRDAVRCHFDEGVAPACLATDACR